MCEIIRERNSISSIYLTLNGHRIHIFIMTSSNGNIFRDTGPLCGEFTCHHKGQWRGALMFSLICACINRWVNTREAGDLRRHCAHYGVNVMLQIWARRVSSRNMCFPTIVKIVVRWSVVIVRSVLECCSFWGRSKSWWVMYRRPACKFVKQKVTVRMIYFHITVETVNSRQTVVKSSYFILRIPKQVNWQLYWNGVQDVQMSSRCNKANTGFHGSNTVLYLHFSIFPTFDVCRMKNSNRWSAMVG